MNGWSGGVPEVVFIPMTRTDIGDRLGPGTESVPRQFSRMNALGVIDLRCSNYDRLCDMDGLMDLAEGDAPVLAI